MDNPTVVMDERRDGDFKVSGSIMAGMDTSPLRRSTRVSAIRATEKIKGDDYVVTMNDILPSATTKQHNSNTAENDDFDSRTFSNGYVLCVDGKRRKLAKRAKNLDPSNCHFHVQQIENGDVVVLSDDSDASSLNEDELDFIKTNYEKLVANELSDEELVVKQALVREAKARLRAEEAKLLLLRKMKLTQQIPPQNRDSSRGLPTNGIASTAPPRPLNNGVVDQQRQGQIRVTNSQNGLPLLQRQQQQSDNNAVSKNGPPFNRAGIQGSAITSQSRPGQPALASRPPMAHQSGVVGNGAKVHPSGTPSTPAPAHGGGSVRNSGSGTPQPVQDSPTAEQRLAAARIALRRQLERSLLQVAPPKATSGSDFHFIPNQNQPDFVCLYGLDYVVQRLIDSNERKRLRGEAKAAKGKDSIVDEESQMSGADAGLKEVEIKKIGILELEPDDPYECAQCGTDFSPYWKPLSDTVVVKKEETNEENDENATSAVLCEHCVHVNRKREIRSQHTAKLKHLFSKAVEQEREIERKVKEGDYKNLPGQLPPPQQQATTTGQHHGHNTASNVVNTSRPVGSLQQQHHASGQQRSNIVGNIGGSSRNLQQSSAQDSVASVVNSLGRSSGGISSTNSTAATNNSNAAASQQAALAMLAAGAGLPPTAMNQIMQSLAASQAALMNPFMAAAARLPGASAYGSASGSAGAAGSRAGGAAAAAAAMSGNDFSQSFLKQIQQQNELQTKLLQQMFQQTQQPRRK